MAGSKTPFEIREDILLAAKDMLQSQYDHQCAMANITFAAAGIGAQMIKDNHRIWEKYMPRMYTPEEVVEAALKMQRFVDNRPLIKPTSEDVSNNMGEGS